MTRTLWLLLVSLSLILAGCSNKKDRTPAKEKIEDKPSNKDLPKPPAIPPPPK
jgi:hypothetical protein